MKLLVVTSIFPPDHGGPASYVPALCSALAERHQVSVVTLSDEVGGHEHYPFSVLRIRRGMNRVLRFARVVAEVRRRSRDADTVYLNGLVLEGIVASTLLRHRPVVVKVVGDLIWERARLAGITKCTVDQFGREKLSLKWRMLRALQNWYMRRADAIITPSDYLREVVKSWGVDLGRIRTIYNAVPPNGSPHPATAEFDLVTVCRLVPWKGVESLIDLAAVNGWRLLIVGDGPQHATLSARARAVGAADRVHFAGQVPKERVRDEMRRARVFVLNSSYEGLPHVVLEAKAAGVPVVATAVGGTPEAIRDGWDGHLVPVGDSVALQRTIATLLANPDLRSRLASNGLKRMATDFSFENMVARSESVLFSGTATGRPLNVLMISRDSTLLAGSRDIPSDSYERHREYARVLAARHPGSELRVVTFSGAEQPLDASDGTAPLRVFGTASKHKLAYVAGALRAVRRALRGGWRPSVVTTQTLWEDGFIGYLMARATGAKFLPQVHLDIFSREWMGEARLNRLRRPLGRWLSSRADGVRVVSSGIAEQMSTKWHLAPRKIHIIPVSVDLRPVPGLSRDQARASLGLPANAPVVLFVGRFYQPKNLHLWVQVAAELQRRLPATRFVLAGDGPDFASVKAHVQRLGLEHVFSFLGGVARDQLPQTYQAADVLLLTSSYEGFGRVIVEARLAGLPVVATDSVGPRDIIAPDQDGYLIPHGDLDALAKAVESLLRDQARARAWGEAARRATEERFAPSTLRASLVRSWEEVASQ